MLRAPVRPRCAALPGARAVADAGGDALRGGGASLGGAVRGALCGNQRALGGANRGAREHRATGIPQGLADLLQGDGDISGDELGESGEELGESADTPSSSCKYSPVPAKVHVRRSFDDHERENDYFEMENEPSELGKSEDEMMDTPPCNAAPLPHTRPSQPYLPHKKASPGRKASQPTHRRSRTGSTKEMESVLSRLEGAVLYRCLLCNHGGAIKKKSLKAHRKSAGPKGCNAQRLRREQILRTAQAAMPPPRDQTR